jgi:hypothetical protein
MAEVKLLKAHENGNSGKQKGSEIGVKKIFLRDPITDHCFPFRSDEKPKKEPEYRYSLTTEKYLCYGIWGINHRLGGINEATEFLNANSPPSSSNIFWTNAIAITASRDFKFSCEQDMADHSTKLVLKQSDLQKFVENGGRIFFGSDGLLLPNALLHVVPSKLSYDKNSKLYGIEGPRITGVENYASPVMPDGTPSEWRGKADPQTGIAVLGEMKEGDKPAKNTIPFGIRPIARSKSSWLTNCNYGPLPLDIMRLPVLFAHIPL